MLLKGGLDGVPRVVVSLNPSVNEFLALLGVEIAGRDAFSYRPAELMKVPIVGTFTDLRTEDLKRISPDLIILYYPVQAHLLDVASQIAKAVAAVPTPPNLDAAVAVFRFFARIFDKDEEGDRLAGIYRDLFKGHPFYEDVVAIINLGVYDVACSNSYVADALTKAGLRYLRGLPCVFRHFEKPPKEIIERASFVVYEARGKAYVERETEFLRDREFVVTPNDTLAHYGPSLPLDVKLIADAAAKGERWVGRTSSVVRPSLRDQWYSPYK
ncbi:conserved hypothetical protein [Pyrobaculum aerophilum str. IM2]|uniref:ABC transporter substrate-binding protein n=2 Tax=Pyrobaculum aerophilum TaxID=13773 RepID=Q8ZY59_PYRAE|nr:MULTISPECIES: ABC transporter substrate-binding protein [Pyrobaculum]AAL63137.1 conserved hypothetical protein [Pyrobaculum aerophilum str. IM2]HII48099.1 ABC transporter substrate-binding protein [Pyrobaculum aerophilum]